MAVALTATIAALSQAPLLNIRVRTIRRLNTVGEVISGDEAPEKYAETIDGLHMLSLALEHLDACVRVLDETGEVLAGGGEFRAAWGAVSDLRDAPAGC